MSRILPLVLTVFAAGASIVGIGRLTVEPATWRLGDTFALLFFWTAALIGVLALLQ